MAVSNNIKVGLCVEGSHGPLKPDLNPNGKRRVRSKVSGTIIKAKGKHKWDIQFDFDGKIKECSSKSLKIVCDEVGVPVNEVGEFNNNNNDIDTTKKTNNNNNNITNEGDSVTASITVVS